MSVDSWCIPPVDLVAAQRLARELDLPRVLAEVLVRRGFADPEAARAFLEPDGLFADPYRLPGITAARAQVDRALRRGQRILVHGDYDADGITAAFLLTEVLRDLGADVQAYLPNRFRDGYGLSPAAVERAAQAGVGLLVTVDCGIKDADAVARARELGLDVVVTDHHQPDERLPDCTIVSPGTAGPGQSLAGVGVAFKLAHALLVEPGGPERVELPLRLRSYVDVAALGTVADVVPLLEENRTLVAMGLGRLRSGPRAGLAALLEVSGTAPEAVSAETIGYRLAPRINAAGRLDEPGLALELLRAPDREAALPLALKLNELNAARQELERAILAEALEMIEEPPPPAVVLHSPEWHEGVVGIVAARVAEQVGRPTILICSGAGIAKGSGRSIPGFDLSAAVRACSTFLVGFGGHPAACGLRIARERIAEFARSFMEYAAAHLPSEALVRRRTVDAVASGPELTLALAHELERLAPHGQGNPRVSLLLHGAELLSPRRTRDGRHLQCRVRCDGACASAIHFNFNDKVEVEGSPRFDVLVELARNSFNGAENAQLKVEALLPLTPPRGDLCETPCDGDCHERLSTHGLWGLLTAGDGGGVAEKADGERDGGVAGEREAAAQAEAAAARDCLRRALADERVLDAREAPLVPFVFSVLAGSERVIVLVADVARRRPLLTRDLPLEALGRSGAYLNGACAARRLERLLGGAEPGREAPAAGVAAGLPAGPERPDVVVASAVTAAAHPALVAAFDRVLFLDPPLDEVSLARVLAAARGRVDFAWGRPEVHFAGKVAACDYDLDTMLRRLWRALPSAGSVAAALERELFVAGPFLAKLPTLLAAWRTLRETGLLAPDGGKTLKGRAGKTDLSRSPTYRLWHQRFPNKPFPHRCLSTDS